MNITVFENDIAMDYGVNEAIILHCIKYWIDKNIANNAEMKDDKYWTYNSIKAFTELLPYLSSRQINSALKHLQAEGIIEVGNYNKFKFDRTQWYSLTEKGFSLFDSQKCKMQFTKVTNGDSKNVKCHFTKVTNGNVENVKPIPNSITNSKPNSYEDNNTISGKPDYTADVHMIIDYLNNKTQQSYRYSESSMRHIRARLAEKFSVADCKKVIDIKNAEWGKDDKMRKYLRPETLFGGKFENYLNQKEEVEEDDEEEYWKQRMKAKGHLYIEPGDN